MNISELKLDLIHRIMELPESALMNVNNILNESSTDWWGLLSRTEQEEIDQGLE